MAKLWCRFAKKRQTNSTIDYERDVDLQRERSRVRRVLSACGLVRKLGVYSHGDIEGRDSVVESKLSWFGRSFLRDRYVYLVSPYRDADSQRSTVYIIERVEQGSYMDPDQAAAAQGYSGLIDEKRGIQSNPLWRFNDGTYGERSALTVFGYWIGSYGDWSGAYADHVRDPRAAVSGGAFAGVPLPDEVRAFDTEQAAYAYIENITGEKIPAQIRHIAWVVIAVSTILWQWHDEIAELFDSIF